MRQLKFAHGQDIIEIDCFSGEETQVRGYATLRGVRRFESHRPVFQRQQKMNDKIDLMLTINGRDYPIRVEPRKTLVDAIRDDCGQTGTHIGCEHGVCGTCTIIVDGEAVRSCLMFAVQAQGKKIRTVEGLADGDKLSVLQQAFIDNHGLQCGYCTPGFLMLATNVLEKNPHIGDEELIDVLSSNLCRCTGYQNIIKAVRAARDEMRMNSGLASNESAPSAAT
jgi:aerobic-type carbon monoxide dehydrogenase small subunit (CoxS/CutS family)